MKPSRLLSASSHHSVQEAACQVKRIDFILFPFPLSSFKFLSHSTRNHHKTNPP